MLRQESKLVVADNSGVLLVKNIKNLTGSFKKSSTTGDFIIVAAQKKKDKSVVKEKIFFGLIIGVKKKVVRLDGSYINLKRNKIVLFQKREKLLGSRIYGVVPFELGKIKLVNISNVSRKMI